MVWSVTFFATFFVIEKETIPVMGMRSALVCWYQRTSLGGISHARDAAGGAERVVWVAVFACCAAFTSVQARKSDPHR